MKVKCKKIFNEHNQREEEKSPWLTINKEYFVLMIVVYLNKNYFLIVDDSTNQAPHLHDAKQFEIISHYIPSNWQINAGDVEVTTLGPKAWQEPNFWEACFEGNHDALEIYKHEVCVMMEGERHKS